ncbi:ABC transporter substrate-binding protein [Paenibacillus sp. PL91]|uniref:ABC transporter substrate-binding protein n=1 Tax=Paenibacillus sp. PL91 TaxID=2729538 RepID=UPI001CB99EF7|nr:extracellular solute-binding protein [Paenibacillus sp. PL91]
MTMKHTKRLMFLTLVLVFLLSACSSQGTKENESATNAGSANNTSTETNTNTSEKPVTISASTNVVGEQAALIQELTEKFMTENPNIKVELTAPGSEYENIMKLKMASNELPDVFSTHGWSQIRYGDYLADLKDEEWVSRLQEAIKPAVTDASGKVYALPMDQDKSGMAYNAEVLEKYGIEIPKTYDELMAAAEKIKTESKGEVVPFHVGGADSWTLGQFFNYFATPLYISPTENDSASFVDGTFDWKKWDQLAQMFLDLKTKGYLNTNVLTAKYSDDAQALAEGKTAFEFYGSYIIEEARKLNPEFKGGFMPIPTIKEGDTPTFAGGEKTTFGVWKDSPNIEAAKKYVAFFAQPENIAAMAKSSALPPGLDGVEVDAGDLTSFYEKYNDTRIIPYFDRVFLPSGMWDVMCKNGADLLAGGIKVEDFSKNMQQEFERLRAVSK